MGLPYEGGCQCEAVRYQITGEPLVVYACHCTICQTQSGSAFGMAARFLSEHFQLRSGTLRSFDRPAVSGHYFTNSFCPECGTRIHHVSSRFPNLISLKPGTLDDTSWLQPAVHIFIRSAQPGVKLPEGVDAFETLPEDISIFGGSKD